jgi:hypothetical protein
MAAPTLYKKKSVEEVKNRSTYSLTSDETTRINTVVSTFFTLFKDKHLG